MKNKASHVNNQWLGCQTSWPIQARPIACLIHGSYFSSSVHLFIFYYYYLILRFKKLFLIKKLILIFKEILFFTKKSDNVINLIIKLYFYILIFCLFS